MDRLIEDTHVDTAVTRVWLQRPIRDQGVPTDALDDRRAETCSSGPTLTWSNREGLNCVSLTKHQRRRARVHVWKSLGRDHPDLVVSKEAWAS